MVPGSRNPMWGEEFNFVVDSLPVKVITSTFLKKSISCNIFLETLLKNSHIDRKKSFRLLLSMVLRQRYTHTFVRYTIADTGENIWLGHCMEEHNTWFCYCSSRVWGAEWTSLVYTWQLIRSGNWFLWSNLVYQNGYFFQLSHHFFLFC